MASRSNTKQRTGRRGLKLWSPSQVKQKNGCETRWGAARFLGIKEEEGENAIKGTFRHGELERWYGRHLYAGLDLNLFLPKTKEACAMMTHMGKIPRGACEVEVACRFDLDDEPFVGYIDMVYDWVFTQDHESPGGAGKVVPLGEGDVTVIHDWKFTSDVKWALDGAGLDPDALKADVAANLYAKEAFEGGAERVFCRWVYCEFDSATPKDLWCEMFYEEVLAVCEEARKVARDGRLKMQALERGALNVLDLPRNKEYCFAFKKECPFKATCKPEADKKPLKMKGREQMSTSDFEKQVDSVTGGERKAPPALPGKKAPPAIPGKKAPPLPGKAPQVEMTDKPESGTFNAPGGPAKASATPEEAVENQKQLLADKGVEIKTGGSATVDSSDLDSLDVAQLKALATALGLEFLPRAKAATVRELILKHRMEQAQTGEAISDITSETAANEPAFTPKTTKEIEKEIADGIEDAVRGDDSKVADVLKQPLDEKELESVVAEKRAVAQRTAVSKSSGYDLFLNAEPRGVPYLTLSEIIAGYMPDFEAETGASDYRALDFAKGKGIIAEAIVDDIKNGAFNGRIIVVDTRTEEGFAFSSVLQAGASLVVRGF